ncbi:nitrate- and nitrite sensing domain-containing protein [Colwellia sp. MEBiC06753]
MLNHLTLKQKLLILTGIPLLAAFIFAMVLIWQASKEVNDANTVSEVMMLAVAISQIVHELQKERGLTAAFYGSNASPSFRSKLEQQRKLSNGKRADKLSVNKALMATMEQLNLVEIINKNQQLLTQLEQIRRQVDAQSISAQQAIEFYTQTNASLLSVVANIASLAKSPEVKQQGLAYYNFEQGKERAGIERAILSNTFAKNTMDLAAYLKLISWFYCRKLISMNLKV